MIVDDRLETVLRTVAAGAAAARTQFRQLVDLLDRVPAGQWSVGHHIGLCRLHSLKDLLTDDERAKLLRAMGLRSTLLVEHFAGEGPIVGLAAISAARLGEAEWLSLVPSLPVQARGFLRHRRDLGRAVEALLARLGIGDFALPMPPQWTATVAADPLPAGDAPQAGDPVAAAPAAADPPPAQESRDPRQSAQEGIGAILRRIEAFRRQRDARDNFADPAAPALPFAESLDFPRLRICEVDVTLDAMGTVVAVAGALGPMLVGHRPFTGETDAPARCDDATLACARALLPISGGKLHLEGAPAVAGTWRLDAVPDFSPTGHFNGYHARLRRPQAAAGGVTPANDDDVHETSPQDSSADRLRQLLHELRTPINAIQGFAELIQQQLFAPTPHQYRSLAASIAADAAQMLAAFEELDWLVRLETGRVERQPGASDPGAIIRKLASQLTPLTAPREVRLRIEAGDEPLVVAIPEEELERTAWRLLSVVAGNAAPGERLAVTLSAAPPFARLALTLPASLAMRDDADLFAPDAGGSRGALPGPAMLGSGFALRVAAAEARAAGGRMTREGAWLVLSIPLVTASDRRHGAA